MTYPYPIKKRAPLDALTGIKSSLSNIRQVISLSYLLYVVNEKRHKVEYCTAEGNGTIILRPEILLGIKKYLNRDDIDNVLADNPMIKNQFEPLYVGLTLLFRLGNLRMEGKQSTSERKGGVRYPKQLYFASNMVLLDLILSGFSNDVLKLSLYEWLQNRNATNQIFENKVCSFLSVCTEYTQFKLRDENGKEIIFQTEGIYKSILDGNKDVQIEDSKECVGPTRIYKNILKESLEPWLSLTKEGITLSENDGMAPNDFAQILATSLDISNVNIETKGVSENQSIKQVSSNCLILPYLTAIRTKPFLLLAGISGTGKSRIVREFAFKSCPKYLQDKNGTTPGNYCMIEVKPNWHDSTELLGYYSRLGKAAYQFKKFVKFLVKAKMYPDVPFFVCLDEMNLAPVEQYFAEILSILETRKHPRNVETGHADMNSVKTEVIIEANHFRELTPASILKYSDDDSNNRMGLTDREIYLKLFDINTREAIEREMIDDEVGKRHDLTTEGLTLPDNVVIIGTVNMDDTTHQFSRKVIDRAMTIEMNGGNLRDMFGGSKNLEYLPDEEQQKWQEAFTRRYVTADEVLEAHPDVAGQLMEMLPERLDEINKALKGTPFEVSYRVLNELTIMVGVMLDDNEDGKSLDDIVNLAVNNILLMKILPRIEGDAEMFALSNDYKKKAGVSYSDRLEWLRDLAPDLQVIQEEEDAEKSTTDGDDDEAEETAKAAVWQEHPQTAKEKIQEMIDRLGNQDFTRFWP